MRVLGVCPALAALLPAVAAADRSETGRPMAACGSASPVASYGTVGRGAALGPLVLWFNGVQDGLAERISTPGFPTRVVIRGREGLRSDLTLCGYQCGTGQRLRFWYRPEPLAFPSGFPATDDELQRAPGKWRLVLSAGSSTVASVLVRVSEESVE